MKPFTSDEHAVIADAVPYIGEIRSMTSRPDPNAERRRRNRKILGL